MNNHFKDGEMVVVNGYGKRNKRRYINKIGQVICRDSYFRDYNIKFMDGTEDYVDAIYIKSLKEADYEDYKN